MYQSHTRCRPLDSLSLPLFLVYRERESLQNEEGILQEISLHELIIFFLQRGLQFFFTKYRREACTRGMEKTMLYPLFFSRKLAFEKQTRDWSLFAIFQFDEPYLYMPVPSELANSLFAAAADATADAGSK